MCVYSLRKYVHVCPFPSCFCSQVRCICIQKSSGRIEIMYRIVLYCVVLCCIDLNCIALHSIALRCMCMRDALHGFLRGEGRKGKNMHRCIHACMYMEPVVEIRTIVCMRVRQ